MKRIYISLLIVLFPSNVFGVVVTDDVINGCSMSQNFIAQYQTKTIVCQQNTYLPADAESCVPCLSGYICSGGTFFFNETKDQGIKIAALFTGTIQNACPLFSNNMYATFALKSITCNPGYYLVADDETCTKCPVDKYCPGGTYTFNETIDQGIMPCPDAHPFAPAGMWQQSQCGRKLHMGNYFIYMHQSPANPTEHRLYTIVNGTVYSANATPKQNGVVDPKMSAGMDRSLHIMLNGVEYLVCDDSVPECRND